MTSVITTFQQWLLFTGTMLVVGCVAWRVQVLPGALRQLGDGAAPGLRVLERRVVSIARAAAGALVVAWVLRLVVQVMGFRDPFVPLWEDVSFLLFEIFWGTVWMAQGAVIVLLNGVLFGADRRGGQSSESEGTPDGLVLPFGGSWMLAAALVPGLALTLSLSGHAVGVEPGRVLAVTADSVHALAAGSWIGTLGVILLIGRTGSGGGPGLFAAQIRSFSPMALVSGALLVLMGLGLSWAHLGAFSDLWMLPYGRILSAKVALALAIFALGFWNWRRGLPDCETVEGAEAVRRRGATEVSLAVAVILLTAVLVHTSKP